MKNRFVYAILLLSAMSQGLLAQEMSEAQEPAGPQPHEMLPSSVMDENFVVHEVSPMPEPPLPSEPEVTLQEEDFVLPESQSEMAEPSEPESEQAVHQEQPVAELQSEEVVYQGPMQQAPIMESKQETSLVNIGLDEQKRNEVVQALQVLLADEYLLYTKTFKYHWNVQGKHFAAMHKFFEKQYEELQGFADGVAERIRMLGFMPPATFEEFTKLATLHEQPGHNPEDLGMIADLLKDHEQVIRNLRGYINLTAQVNDMGSNNFLADLIDKHEKMAWMLRAHLER